MEGSARMVIGIKEERLKRVEKEKEEKKEGESIRITGLEESLVPRLLEMLARELPNSVQIEREAENTWVQEGENYLYVRKVKKYRYVRKEETGGFFYERKIKYKEIRRERDEK